MPVNYQRRILHAIMSLPDSIGLMSQVIELVSPEHFSGNDRRLYEIMIERWNKGLSIKLVDMVELYEDDETMEKIIDDGQRIYAVTSVLEYCKLVKERSQLDIFRKLGKTLSDMTLNNEAKVADLIGMTDTYVLQVQKTGSDESKRFSDVWTGMEERISRSKGKELLGATTTFHDLDFITKGLQEKTYWVVGGQTSIGKSLFTQHLVRGCLLGELPVLVISLELSAEDVGFRLLGSISGVSLSSLYRDGISAHKTEIDKFSELLHINDTCSTLSDVLYAIRAASRKHGVKLVVVDYLQNIQVPKSQTEYQSLNEITLRLQRSAQLDNCCIIAVSQLGRDTSPDLFSFKGSGNLENSADIGVILSKNPEMSEKLKREILKITVVKNRLFGTLGSFDVEKDMEKGVLSECTELPF